MRIVIADDAVLIREGLSALLRQAGMTVLAAVKDAHELLDAVAGHRPDAVIVDIRMPPTYTTEGSRSPSGSGGTTPASRCWSSPCTSRRSTRWRSSTRVRVASDICSRSASSTSSRWSPRCVSWRAVERSSIRPSSRS
ncbi:response regulator [Micromonospora sp. BRA006-A]|nr:response regulator [Micromonospora sp. BRA006-A]